MHVGAVERSERTMEEDVKWGVGITDDMCEEWSSGIRQGVLDL